VLWGEFVYGQVIKYRRKYRTAEAVRRIVCGEAEQYRARLQAARLSGRINTAFGERVNLTIRQCVSKLTRRTWGPAKYTPELMEHLEWCAATITLRDHMKAWRWHWAYRSRAKANSSPRSTGAERRQ
jgi:hypothetical protein